MPSERVQRQLDALLDEAETAIRAEDWDTVQARCNAVLRLDPENEDARAYLEAASRDDTVTIGDGGTRSSGAKSSAATASQLPDSFVGGRYRVERFLGEGGKKRVFLAHDTTLDRDVAFGQFRTEGMDAAGRARVTQEAQAMGRVGTHPNLVAIHDIGEEAGAPFIVQEYVAGGDLAALVADGPAPLGQTLEVGRAVCSALAFIHGRQLVHRDLKPSNVFLAEDGTPKLGDFGLAVSLDRTRLTQEGSFLGTAAYMPPEQALGGEVTARSDLYSLGAMLYELVTGRPPFVGDDTTAVVAQHINTPPVAPSWHRPECPPGLDALLLRLLEKAPEDRPATAEEVATALAAIDVETAAPPGPTAAPPESTPLYRTTFVGRERELGQLKDAFDAAVSGQGGLAMVVGEPGIGKTTLVEQLGTYALMRGGRTLTGHCYEEGSLSIPYLPFVEAMRGYVPTLDPDSLRSQLGSNAGDVARIVAEIRDHIDVPPPPEAPPDEERYRLLRAVTAFLRNAAEVQPLVIVLEDLHDADRGTLDLLNHLARNLAGSRLLIIGTYRDVEVDRAHPLSGALAELRRGASFGRVTLRGLTVDEVQRMLSNIADQDVPMPLAEAVFRQTEGNPLFVQEVVRYLAEEGLIARADGVWQATGGAGSLLESIPEGLRDVIGKRLSRLSREANDLLAFASVIGRDFDLETLRAVAEVSEEQLADALEEAVHVSVLEEWNRLGGARYRFTHAFFRQTLYEELIAPRRIRLHQRIARVLEEQYAGRLDEHAAELAEHYSQSSDARDLAKAVEYGRRAAGRASDQYAYGEAVRQLERALGVQEVLDDEETMTICDILLELSRALLSADELPRADAAAERAYGLAVELDNDGRASEACTIALEAMFSVTGPTARQTPRGALLVERLSERAPPETIAEVWAKFAQGFRPTPGEGDLAESRASWAEAFEIARKIDDPNAFFLAAGMYLWRFESWGEDERRVTAELLDRAGTGERARWRAWGIHAAASASLRGGEADLARQLCGELIDLAETVPESAVAAYGLCGEIVLAQLDGELERVLDTAARLSGETGLIFVRLPTLYPCLMLGRFDSYLAMRPTSGPWDPFFRALQGEKISAEEAYQDFEPAPWPPEISLLVLDGAIYEDYKPKIRQLADFLASLPLRVTGTWLTVVDRHLGEAYAAVGEVQEALTRFNSAVELATETRWRPEVAVSRFGRAKLLLEHYPDERGAALEEIDWALGEFQAMKMRPYVEEALRIRLEHRGVDSADPQTSLVALTTSVEADRPDVASAVAPDGTVTLLFSDIEDSTRHNVELGDDAWMRLLGEHNRLVRDAIATNGGFEVKTEGDAFMVAFGSARDAVRCAQAMQRALDARSEEPRLRIRIGLHTGEPIREADDFYGTHVVLASRICSQASGGEILVSSLLRDLVAASGEFELTAHEPTVFKGLDGEHVTYAVGWA